MPPLTIKFQCFIPNSLGKPIFDYFKNQKHFNKIKNRAEFTKKLKALDSNGYTWLPEPGGSITDNYFATDNIDLHDESLIHDTRLGFHMQIEPEKIGDFSYMDNVFEHAKHGNGWGGVNSQHSGESHQVKAYIKREPVSYIDTGTAFMESGDYIYTGICKDKIAAKRSKEEPLTMNFENKLLGTYYHQAGAIIPKDSTVFKISASAGYPFAEPLSPNIDFELEIQLTKNLTSRNITINISGWHNDFPAYELIIGNEIVYNHNPVKFGYTGPTPRNLTKSREFNFSKWIRLEDWEVRDIDKRTKFER